MFSLHVIYISRSDRFLQLICSILAILLVYDNIRTVWRLSRYILRLEILTSRVRYRSSLTQFMSSAVCFSCAVLLITREPIVGFVLHLSDEKFPGPVQKNRTDSLAALLLLKPLQSIDLILFYDRARHYL